MGQHSGSRTSWASCISGTGSLAKAAAAVVLALTVSACGGTDVELKGGVFEAAGLTNLNAKREETKLQERPGLVLPPKTASLPAPGAVPQQAVGANGEAFPIDPEEAKVSQKKAIVAQHEAFCKKARERKEAGLTEVIEDSPWGSCHESVMKLWTGRSVWGNKVPGSE